jgi:hypothetical protein
MLGLVSEWWTGNHVNDRSDEPCRPPSCVAPRGLVSVPARAGRALGGVKDKGPPMISLDDPEMAAVMALAQPLQPRERTRFLQAIEVELQALGGAVGAGTVHRVESRLQRQFLRTPHGPG